MHAVQSKPIVYPDSDGLPMADNPIQYECIVTLHGGLNELMPDWVGANNFWYPVENRPKINTAPDVYVAIGRPKGYRPSYKQWEEGGVAPQVVFEIISPSNSYREMIRKGNFYLRYGVEEFYTFDPDSNEWGGFIRVGDEFEEVKDFTTWVSPRLGIRFDPTADYMRVLGPNGVEFETFQESKERRRQAEHERDRAVQTAEDLRTKLRAAGIDPDA